MHQKGGILIIKEILWLVLLILIFVICSKLQADEAKGKTPSQFWSGIAVFLYVAYVIMSITQFSFFKLLVWILATIAIKAKFVLKIITYINLFKK